MGKYKVYLAGPINGCTDDECKRWREQAKNYLRGSFEIVDPMDRDWRGIENHNATEIVNYDLDRLKECDIILANCFKPTVGTSCEIVYAYQLGLLIISAGSTSPWIAAHSDFNKEIIEEAIVFLMELYWESDELGYNLMELVGPRFYIEDEHRRSLTFMKGADSDG